MTSDAHQPSGEPDSVLPARDAPGAMDADRIRDTAQLEELLSRPTPAVVDLMRRLSGDLMLLGAGGKIGPSLARMARRATDLAQRPRTIYGVSRFTNPQVRDQLAAAGIETLSCDLLDPQQRQQLPSVPNLVFLTARKFGSTGSEDQTWLTNVYLSAVLAEQFRESRIVAYSSGNIYRLVDVHGPGSAESDDPAPVGEYGTTVLGRERLLTAMSRRYGTDMAFVRLNYANEMRYGTLRDIGQAVWDGRPIDVTMAYFNAIWQGDNNALTLLCFDHVSSPPSVWNVTGLDKLSVRAVAQQFGRIWDKPVKFEGTEASTALLSDARRSAAKLGRPEVSETQLIRWLADWIERAMPSWDKPTHFQRRDGRF